MNCRYLDIEDRSNLMRIRIVKKKKWDKRREILNWLKNGETRKLRSERKYGKNLMKISKIIFLFVK